MRVELIYVTSRQSISRQVIRQLNVQKSALETGLHDLEAQVWRICTITYNQLVHGCELPLTHSHSHKHTLTHPQAHAPTRVHVPLVFLQHRFVLAEADRKHYTETEELLEQVPLQLLGPGIHSWTTLDPS